ncbi:MAG: hypothetical protein KC613_18545, partial [Myxococcales bacterium]|nr:hypothetical protein [Myxococcales bacterium]
LAMTPLAPQMTRPTPVAALPGGPDVQATIAHLAGRPGPLRALVEGGFEPGAAHRFHSLYWDSGRATLPSAYQQAVPGARALFALHGLVSAHGACPFAEGCPSPDVFRAVAGLRTFGVGDLCVHTPRLVAEADFEPALAANGAFGPWRCYAVIPPPALVDLWDAPPPVVPAGDDWRQRFAAAVTAPGQPGPPRLVGEHLPPEVSGRLGEADVWAHPPGCAPTVTVEPNRLVLDTPCPGHAHRLKYSFHGSFRADTGDVPFLVEPGFIGLIPSARRVVLTFGATPGWRVAGWGSLWALLGLLLAGGARARRWIYGQRAVSRPPA